MSADPMSGDTVGVDPIGLATAAATSIVGLLATDAWEKAKDVIGALWRRVHPDRAETVLAELAETRAEVVAARTSGDEQAERELTGEWQGRLRRLLAADPDVAAELTRLLDEVLRPALAQATTTVTMHATAYG